jgi:hypothetical protein
MGFNRNCTHSTARFDSSKIFLHFAHVGASKLLDHLQHSLIHNLAIDNLSKCETLVILD